MTYGIPQSDHQRVHAEIGAVLERTTRYLSADDWDIRRLNKAAEQLFKANDVEGSNALAALWQLTGDREKALRHIDYAIEHADVPDFYRTCKVTILANLGYFSESLDLFRTSSAPDNGNMTNAWDRGYMCAAFRTMKSFLPQAKKMNFDLGGLDLDTAVYAANVMEKAGVADDDVAKVMDVVGHVMRSHRRFFAGNGLRTNVCEGEDYDAFIEMSFDFDGSSRDVHALYQEFVDQVTEHIPLVPSVLVVSFRPWNQQNERNAA